MNRREAIKRITSVAVAGSVAAAHSESTSALTQARPAKAERDNDKTAAGVLGGDLECWLENSLRRVYPTSTAQEASSRALVKPGDVFRLRAARNFRLSFQACFRNLISSSATVKCETVQTEGVTARIRRVGFVPMQNLDTYVPLDELEGIGKIPGLCPDPLWPEDTSRVGPQGTGVFWISLFVPAGTPAGKIEGKVRLTLLDRYGYTDSTHPEKVSIDLPFEIQVADVKVERRKDFPATIWLSADSIWEYYKIAPFSERFWELADAYIKNLVEHGIDVIYTPIFNIRAEKLVRPAQLLKVKRTAGDKYEFDFSDVRKWIKLAMSHGANYVEFSHLFSPAPDSAAFPQHIYKRDDSGIGELLWPEKTPATSETYRNFLSQFLPPFKQMLEEEGVLDKSLFHCADEPDGDVQMANYRKARAFLKEMAPWIKVMDAMSDPRFATEKLSDMPIPSISTAKQFTSAGCPAWVYYCCGPRAGYIQRLLDTPLYKIRASGWLFYKLKAQGFLHWGYNYWFKFCTDQIGDPFQDASNGAWPGMPYGDTFAVYPGTDGPIDSIRWEVFAESLQDYALLQSAGIKPDDALLAKLNDYNDFPKSAQWIEESVAMVLG